jgi:amino acid transporter
MGTADKSNSRWKKTALWTLTGVFLGALLFLVFSSRSNFPASPLLSTEGGTAWLALIWVAVLSALGLLVYRSWKGSLEGELLNKYNSPKARFIAFLVVFVIIPSFFIYCQSNGDGATNVIQYLFAVVTLAFIWLFTQPLPVVESRLQDLMVPVGQRVLEVKCKSSDASALQVVNVQASHTHLLWVQLGCQRAQQTANTKQPDLPTEPPTPAS